MTRGFTSARSHSEHLIQKLEFEISPLNIANTLDQPNYDAFFEFFETGAHNAIPQFVNGEWLSLTAPNGMKLCTRIDSILRFTITSVKKLTSLLSTDPVFFLHHTQVDRLWWIWQQRDPEKRLSEFNGPAKDFLEGDNSSHSSLTDILPMAGLVEDKIVADVLDTNQKFLCYRY